MIISLIALALVAATAGIIRNRKLQKKIDRGELDAMPEVQEVDSESLLIALKGPSSHCARNSCAICRSVPPIFCATISPTVVRCVCRRWKTNRKRFC